MEVGDLEPRLAEVAVVVGSVAEVEFEAAFGLELTVEWMSALAVAIAAGLVLRQ